MHISLKHPFNVALQLEACCVWLELNFAQRLLHAAADCEVPGLSGLHVAPFSPCSGIETVLHAWLKLVGSWLT